MWEATGSAARRRGESEVTAKHLIAYAIILLALAGIALVILRSRRRSAVHHERIDITRDDSRS